MVYDSVNRIYIDTDNVLLITTDEYRFYTFAVYREDSRFVENLIFKFNTRDEFSAVAVRYNFTAEDITNIKAGRRVDIRGKMEGAIVPVEDGQPCFQWVRIQSFSNIDGQIEFSEWAKVEVPCPPDSSTEPGGGGQ